LRLGFFMPCSFRAFIMFRCWILPNAFAASIEMVIDFCPQFCLCAVFHLLACTCWIILESLEWNKLDHGIWFFKCVVEFSLQVFYWRFLHLSWSRILVYSFLFYCVLILFWFGGNTDFIDWVWRHFSLSIYFMEQFEEHWCSSFKIW
jgi:hypothetical protein